MPKLVTMKHIKAGKSSINKTAIKYTKAERSFVKLYQKLPQELKDKHADFYQMVLKENDKFSKNPIKNIISWLKTYKANVKLLKSVSINKTPIIKNIFEKIEKPTDTFK